MGDLYNIFSKEKVEPPKLLSYKERFKKCYAVMEQKGYCDCDLCLDKIKLSQKLTKITEYLCADYMETTGKTLYVADVLEIMIASTVKFKNDIIKG